MVVFSFHLSSDNEPGTSSSTRNNNVTHCCSGFCIDLLEKFRVDLGFTYELNRVEDPKFGTHVVRPHLIHSLSLLCRDSNSFGKRAERPLERADGSACQPASRHGHDVADRQLGTGERRRLHHSVHGDGHSHLGGQEDGHHLSHRVSRCLKCDAKFKMISSLKIYSLPQFPDMIAMDTLRVLSATCPLPCFVHIRVLFFFFFD